MGHLSAQNLQGIDKINLEKITITNNVQLIESLEESIRLDHRLAST